MTAKEWLDLSTVFRVGKLPAAITQSIAQQLK